MPPKIYRFSYDTKNRVVVKEEFYIADQNELYVKCYHQHEGNGMLRHITVYVREFDVFDNKDRMFMRTDDHEKFIRDYFAHMHSRQEELRKQIADIDDVLSTITLTSK